MLLKKALKDRSLLSCSIHVKNETYTRRYQRFESFPGPTTDLNLSTPVHILPRPKNISFGENIG